MRLVRLFVSPPGFWPRRVAGFWMTVVGLYRLPTHESLGYLVEGVGLVPVVAAVNDVGSLALVFHAGTGGDDLRAQRR